VEGKYREIHGQFHLRKKSAQERKRDLGKRRGKKETRRGASRGKRKRGTTKKRSGLNCVGEGPDIPKIDK